jgi:DnaK suppressor protein
MQFAYWYASSEKEFYLMGTNKKMDEELSRNRKFDLVLKGIQGDLMKKAQEKEFKMNQELATKFLGMFEDVLGQKASDQKLKLLLKEEGLKEITGDDADKASEVAEEKLQQRLDQRDALYVKKIKAAKERILNGSYGLCEDCGAEISHKRLLARPTATMCISCKEEQEFGELGNINNRRDLKGAGNGEIADGDNLIDTNKFRSITDIKFESIVENF